MRIFALSALMGVALGQQPFDQCKSDIADAQDALNPVETSCEANTIALGTVQGQVAPVSAVLPVYNKKVVKNSANV